jgi:hypothetical protein
MSYVIRRYCRPLFRNKIWNWQDVQCVNDEALARQRFGEIVERRGYSDSCRGYALVARHSNEQHVIMSSFDYRH